MGYMATLQLSWHGQGNSTINAPSSATSSDGYVDRQGLWNLARQAAYGNVVIIVVCNYGALPFVDIRWTGPESSCDE